jgi:predicted dehydrogenase
VTAKVGVVGAGNISPQYLKHIATYPDVEIVVISDLIEERSAERAKEYGVATHGTPGPEGSDIIYDNADVEYVINITNPQNHIDVSLEAIRAGKHVWSEKPLGLNLAGAKQILNEAEAHGVVVGCAPDTVFGPGFQTVLRKIRSGAIGKPMGGLAIMQQPGPDLWHPGPEFLFQVGAGPTLDIGPYYFTALVLGLGDVTSVTAGGGKAREVRTVMKGPKAGTEFEVEVPTDVRVLLRHSSGATSLVLLTFDSGLSRHGMLEFQGTEGVIVAPDPNVHFGKVVTHKDGKVVEELDVPEAGMGRGIGLVDMVRSIKAGLRPRAHADLAYHVLEVMLAVQTAVESGETVQIQSKAPEVDPIPADWTPLQAG